MVHARRATLSRQFHYGLLALLLGLGVCCTTQACGRGRSTLTSETREAAYRSNNRGVGLLEQFAHESAVSAFREALELNPSMRLARINLPIALFYAGMNQEAAAQARAAVGAYPGAPQPLFILGLIARAENRPDEALDAFRRILQIDPDDVGSKVNLALIYVQQRRYAEAVELSRSALALEPYNATAAYNLSLALSRMGDAAAGSRAMQRFEELRAAGYSITYSQTYLEQGRYAEAIASNGAEADLVSTAPPAVTFSDATANLLGNARPPATAPRDSEPALPTGGVTLADIDQDGDLDIIISGLGVRVLRNDRTRLVDVTEAVGLRNVGARVVASVAGDFNNDSRVDLVLLTGDGPRVFAQDERSAFREVNIRQPSTLVPRTARAAAFADVDHDGDLDLIVGGRLLRNNGNATFTDVTAAAALEGVSTVVAVAPTDFDNRRDIDLLMVSPGERPRLFRNMRTGSFADVAAASGLPEAGAYTSVAVGDVNKDGFTDAFFGLDSAPGVWAVSDGRGRFRIEDGPPATRGAIAAQILDYDNDGLLDLLTIARDGPRLFRSVGRQWLDDTDRAMSPELREAVRSANGITAAASGDLDLDGDTDIVAILGTGAVRIWRNEGGNRNNSLRVTLTGRVSNREGIGAKVELRAGSLHQKMEIAATAPPAVPADLVFGLGARTAADVIRVVWPSGTVQAETELRAASADRGPLRILELNRKPSSCPYLFTWNGSRFEFVTDFLGGGEMGSWLAPNARNIPQPVEYVRISDRQMRARNGRFEIRVTNELEEVLYLDHLELLAVTHPSDVDIFPDEGLRAGPRRSRPFATRNARPVAAATDDQGRDVLPLVSHLDRRSPDDFELSPIRGYAAEHAITLTLPAARARPPDRTVLLLTGWTDYAFSADNVAASQAGLSLNPPALHVKDEAGRWRTVNADIGFPVGRPQTLVVDITRFPQHALRIVTTMRIYWDQILVADAVDISRGVESVPVRSARLRWRGFSAEVTPDGREPFAYDYDRVLLVAPWKLMPGRYTREGEVGELIAQIDDRFVVSRPGDEVELSFDAAALPPLPKNARRTFLLHSAGFSKEMDLHSASPDHAAPIPFRAMSRYPYTARERYPHVEDLDRFHTRVVSRAIPTLAY